MDYNKIRIYCDGGCRNNQKRNNIGGYGIVLNYKDYKKELNGYEFNTTNNRMELIAAIKSLQAVNNKDIATEVICDSQYVISGITQWISGWIRRNWKNSRKQPVENKDLWIKLLEEKNKFRNISFIKCKGHSNNEGNERADCLVNEAMDKGLEKEVYV